MTNQPLPTDWDASLQELGGTILQSEAWFKFQKAIRRESIWGREDGWMWLATVRQSRGLKYILCSYGPVAKNPGKMQKALIALVEKGIAVGADFIRLEPQKNIEPQELRAKGARKISEVQPEHTQVIDLNVAENDLRSGLASGHRNLINGTKRRGVSIRTSNDAVDFEDFLKMLEDTAKRSSVRFYPEDYYRKLWEVLGKSESIRLYIAKVEGYRVAGALFYDWGGIRYYAHAGAWQEANRRHKASVSLVWQAIIDAKKLGFQKFDLWGVAGVDDPRHPWAGITKFKKGFGGTPVSYLGTWDIPLKRNKYQAYTLYRRLRGRK